MVTEWWIDEPNLLGSANPTTQRLRELYAQGFRAVICLLDDRQYPYYDVAEITTLGFTRCWIPVEDFCAPSRHQLLQFITTVHEVLQKGRVLVHCQAGLGRTGVMAAAYWIKRGLPAEEAITRVRRARPGAIESPEQRACLLELEKSLRETGER